MYTGPCREFLRGRGSNVKNKDLSVVIFIGLYTVYCMYVYYDNIVCGHNYKYRTTDINFLYFICTISRIIAKVFKVRKQCQNVQSKTQPTATRYGNHVSDSQMADISTQ